MEKLKFLKFGLASLLLAAILSSCGKVETFDVQSENIELSAEGPLFVGSNTAQGEWEIDLQKVLEMKDLKGKKLKSLKITSINLRMIEDSAAFLLEDITFLMTASGASMQKVGFINPAPQTVEVFSLQIAEEQKDILDIFQNGKVTLVADFNLADDWYDNLSFETTLSMELSYEQ